MTQAFFDLDDTLIQGDSVLYWLRFYYRNRPNRRFFLVANWFGILLYLLRLIPAATLKRFFYLPLAYEPTEMRERFARQFVHRELIRHFYPEMLARIQAHLHLGHQVTIISASATLYLKYLPEVLPGCKVLGTEMVFPAGVWRLPSYTDGNLKGRNKISRIQQDPELAERSHSFAYSDHHSDRFLLGFSQFPFCVQPNRKLRNIAAKRRWPIMRFATSKVHWRIRLEKGILFLLMLGPFHPSQSEEMTVEKAFTANTGTLEQHADALKARVSQQYPEERYPEVFAQIFPNPAE